MSFVVDASVTIGWCFEDESDSFPAAVLDRLTSEEALVPSHWPLEVANVLLVGERKGRLTRAEAARFIELLGGLPIRIDGETAHRGFADALDLGRDHDLSAHDAAYLELAMRTGLPLATTDTRLRRAAAEVGVALVPS